MQNNSNYPVVQLQKGKDEAIKRFHPWVFSGAIRSKPEHLKAGALVTLQSHKNQILGTGFFEDGNIAIKLVSFKDEIIDNTFWLNKLEKAFALRSRLGLVDDSSTNAYRLVHSEGDGLPGLIIDIYATTAVIQAQSAGIYTHRKTIAESLLQVMGGRITAVFDKSAEALERMNKEAGENAYLFGKSGETTVKEYDALFAIDWEKGQKTGFFLDQRENRALLKQLSAGRKVLNTFSYSGGFSVFALKGGAKSVVSVDSSKRAIELCDQNVELNGFDSTTHQSICVDAKKYLEQMEEHTFDLIVLDPPAFAKNHHSRHKGLLGYKFINYEAIRKIAPGGILFTFSCSQAVDRQSFQSIVMAAAIETGRPVRILHQLSQPADHPLSIFHPEGAYLKGLVLEIG